METREAIRTEFMRMYARERMDRITVKALCAAAPVARTTFYAHYRNVDDVLREVEDGLLAGLAEVTERVSGGDLTCMDFPVFLDETLAFVDRNRADFHALLVAQPDMRFVSRWKDAMKANMTRRYPMVSARTHWDLITEMGIKTSDIDAVLLTHLDCDHANGLVQVKDAKRFVVAADEVRFASKLTNRVRYNKSWWGMVELDEFEWNDDKGPFGKSYDLLGDGSIQLINIPGHADGLFAVKVVADDGRFVLLFSDGGYAAKSWQEMITSGIAADKEKQKTSLAWIREQSLDPMCVESLANHDPDVEPHVIEL